MNTESRIIFLAACVASAAVLSVSGIVAQRPQTTVSSAEEALPDRDSLAAMVRYLSVDPETGQPRSRYVCREAEIREIADTLAARLERYTGGPSLRQNFTVDKHDSVFGAENVIARYPAPGFSAGVFIVCAHYDAIASRTPGWNADWEHMPAPGADDNATGVAALLEAARVLAGTILPFDVEFVLFSAEELDLLGSRHYVEQCGEECAENLLGVVNLDMLGFSGDGEGASCMSDFRSGWIADLLLSHAAVADPRLRVTLIKPAAYNWDHASFWSRDAGMIPAVTLSQPLVSLGSVSSGNDVYHTVDDIAEHVDFDQVYRIGSIVAGFIASFAERPGEMSLLPSDILLLAGETVRPSSIFEEGENAFALVRVRNTGGAPAPQGAQVRLGVHVENEGGWSTLFYGTVDPVPPPLRSNDVLVPIPTDAENAGGNRLRASISVSGMPDSDVDNTAEIEFTIVAGQRLLRGHFFRPHPVRGRFGEATLCVNLAGEADLMVEIYTLEGQKVASAALGSGYGVPIPQGLSCHACGDIFEGTKRLAPGIYLYRITVYDVEGNRSQYTDRFAVAN